MNILGISGAIGWDGNISYNLHNIGDFWSHGSGATLIMDGKLKNAICEERFSRIKHDGNYPKLAIQHILDYNKITKDDIDLVVYVCSTPRISFELRESGYTESKLLEYFPNSKVYFLPHHIAHTAATFFTSGFDEANILSFDGAGDGEVQSDGSAFTPHMKFSHGKDSTITVITTNYCDVGSMHNSFGFLYNMYSHFVYQIKMAELDPNHNKNYGPDAISRETYPGKVMGLSAYGDHRNIDLPEWFLLESTKQKYVDNKWEDCIPELMSFYVDENASIEAYMQFKSDDLAAWLQHQFEKYLLLFLSNIPESIKHDNLCLGGGSALNILANSKIIEQGIYKNVHVNTAPNDDGLHFGAAIYMSVEKEQKIILPEDVGYLGITYTDEEIDGVLSL